MKFEYQKEGDDFIITDRQQWDFQDGRKTKRFERGNNIECEYRSVVLVTNHDLRRVQEKWKELPARLTSSDMCSFAYQLWNLQ